MKIKQKKEKKKIRHDFFWVSKRSDNIYFK